MLIVLNLVKNTYLYNRGTMCCPLHNGSQNHNISQAEINLSTMFHYSLSKYK